MSLRERLHAEADGAWRSPRAVPSLWPAADDVDERLLKHTERGAFWDTLADAGVKGVLNFAPVRGKRRENVPLKNVDLRINLKELAFFLR